jgi:hypothetical protein
VVRDPTQRLAVMAGREAMHNVCALHGRSGNLPTERRATVPLHGTPAEVIGLGRMTDDQIARLGEAYQRMADGLKAAVVAFENFKRIMEETKE